MKSWGEILLKLLPWMLFVSAIALGAVLALLAWLVVGMKA